MLSKKAGVKWLKIFIVMVVVTAGVIFVFVLSPIFFAAEICPVGQGMEIQKVIDKVEEVKLRPGYEVVYFKMKDCARQIVYDDPNITVTYDEDGDVYDVGYEVNAQWDLSNLPTVNVMDQRGSTYTFYVYADVVIVYS